MSFGVGHRHSSDLAWLWLRLGAIAPIGPLAWEPPYAVGEALKRQKKKKKKEKSYVFFFLIFCLFSFSRALPAAHGGS